MLWVLKRLKIQSILRYVAKPDENCISIKLIYMFPSENNKYSQISLPQLNREALWWRSRSFVFLKCPGNFGVWCRSRGNSMKTDICHLHGQSKMQMTWHSFFDGLDIDSSKHALLESSPCELWPYVHEWWVSVHFNPIFTWQYLIYV